LGPQREFVKYVPAKPTPMCDTTRFVSHGSKNLIDYSGCALTCCAPEQTTDTTFTRGKRLPARVVSACLLIANYLPVIDTERITNSRWMAFGRADWRNHRHRNRRNRRLDFARTRCHSPSTRLCSSRISSAMLVR